MQCCSDVTNVLLTARKDRSIGYRSHDIVLAFLLGGMPRPQYYVCGVDMSPELSRSTDAVIRAVEAARAATSGRPKHEMTLDAFWCLQDRLHQLLAHIRDDSWEITALSEANPNLVTSVVDVLSRASKSPIFQLAAIRQACTAINESLMQLQMIKDGRRYATAQNGS